MYTQTELKSCVGTYPKQWNRVVYMLNESQDTPQNLARLRSKYPQGVYKEWVYTQSTGITYKVFSYTVEFPNGTPVGN